MCLFVLACDWLFLITYIGDNNQKDNPIAMSKQQFSSRPASWVVIVGTFIDTPTPHTLRVRKDHYCIVSPTTGKITHLGPLTESHDDPVRILGAETYRESVVVWLQSSQFVCPGMIDTHCHAPQYRQMGSANNLPLVTPLRISLMPARLVEQSDFSE